jgi:hypothetical protein
MPKTLTVFIDGLPFDQLHNMPSAKLFKAHARLVPILGYSVNCQTQLFTGKFPDELGFWCEFTYAPKTSPLRRWKPLFQILRLAEVWYPFKRIAHRVLDKMHLVSSTKNIPFAYLADFDETGHTVFAAEFGQESLLDHPDMKCFLYRDFPGAANVDEEIFQACHRYLKESDDPGNVMMTFVGIDHCSHWDGVASPAYNKMLARNDDYIRELHDAFKEKYPDGKVLVVSDHGMVNIDFHVNLDLENNFGKPADKGYAYFTEGTLLRVWCEDPKTLAELRTHLDGVEGIERLPDEERPVHGITDPSFGDLIYHTLEGGQLVPSFWGPKPSVGMHGYHPRYRSQHGICLSTSAEDFSGEVHASDFYKVLARELGPAGAN